MSQAQDASNSSEAHPEKVQTAFEHTPASWLKKLRENINSFRIDRQEVSGSLGDMGTFIPLLVGMVSVNGLNLASALFFAGLVISVTVITLGFPMAVQPMKAIAIVAFSSTAVGFVVGLVLAYLLRLGTFKIERGSG